MSATMSLNGQPRKQLSDQIDRLDGILDVLEEGLTGAIHDALKDGTRVAVHQAMTEILTNAEFLATIRGTVPAPSASPAMSGSLSPVATTTRTSLWSRMKTKLHAVKSKVVHVVSHVVQKVGNIVRSAWRGVKALSRRVVQRVSSLKSHLTPVIGLLEIVRQSRHVALAAVGIGTTTGLLSLLAPQVTVAITSGLTMALTWVGFQLIIRARQLWQQILPPMKR